MKEQRFTFTAEDGTTLYAVRWSPSGMIKVRGTVQIVHGMAEHKERYRGFAEHLAGEGFAVYIHDVRGHGESAGSVEAQGFFAEKDGWMKSVDDIRILGRKAREETEGLPFFLFGHSMGSLMARTFALTKDDTLSGLVLSGTSAGIGALAAVGRAIAGIQAAFRGPRFPSQLLNNMNFGAFNKPYEPARTPFDWLSRDEKVVDAYIADPYCGAVFSCGFYRDLLAGVTFVSDRKNIARIMKDLPILLLSGEEDPVGGNGKGVRQVASEYRDAGCTDVTLRLYPGARHEILNETNRSQVYRDITEWMKGRL